MTDRQDEIIRKKTTQLEAARIKLKEYLDKGGDLKSSEVVPIGVEFIQAYNDLSKEFGYEILKPLKQKEEKEEEKTPEWKNANALLKMFTFDKKRELEKYCRDLVINSTAFANFILACEFGKLPFVHQIYYQDRIPEHLHLSDEDTTAIASNPVGPLQPGALKAVRKIGQIFKDRRYLVGHIFYTSNLTEWHFFQFDQRDLEDECGNHWKEGAHIHFINWLWPHYEAKTLWENFTLGKAKMNDSLHIRYFNSAREKDDEKE